MSTSNVSSSSASMPAASASTPATGVVSPPGIQPQGSPHFNFEGLPTETQVMVWEHLHLTERLALLRVSEGFKARALAARRLWTHIDYFCVTDAGWVCECQFVDGVSSSHAWERHFYPEQLAGLENRRGTNLKDVKYALSLSGGLDISLSLTFTVPNHAPRSLAALSKALQAHADRIKSIDITAWSDKLPASLLDSFAHLPALRRLTTHYVQCQMPAATEFTNMTNALPALEDITFETPHTVLPDLAGFTLPSLRKLSFHVTDVGQIAHALLVCPQLTTLLIYLNLDDGRYVQPRSGEVQKIESFCQRLQHVWIEGVVPLDEDWVLAAFGKTALKSLEMAYERAKAPSAGWRAFGRLTGDITLDVAYSSAEGEVTLRATGALGMVRVITVTLAPHDILDAVFKSLLRALCRPKDRLRAGKVTRVRLDVAALPAFAAEFPRNNKVAELELVASRRWTYENLLLMDDTPVPRTCVFSAITRVRLVRADRAFPAFNENKVSFLQERFQIDIDYDDDIVSGDAAAQPLTIDLPARPRA